MKDRWNGSQEARWGGGGQTPESTTIRYFTSILAAPSAERNNDSRIISESKS